jgi:L-cysteine:1D-myo-inositol 2-amino-2-deoxy-alpha-D-glucopyranoside ligase
MYTCGITPYDATHLGHAATFIAYDVLQRRLIDMGHTVKCVRNVTDVDDPLFAKARQLGVHYLDLAAGEEARFERDMEALNALPVSSSPRASSAIPDIRGFIGMVLDRGFAYQAGGSVYFDVSKFPSFGSISNYSRAQMIEFARERGGNVDDPHKRDALDFVCASVGNGRAQLGRWGPVAPAGIECSALRGELGTTIDCTAAVQTSSSASRMRSAQSRLRPVIHSFGIGCTWRWCTWTVTRCRRVSATWSSSMRFARCGTRGRFGLRSSSITIDVSGNGTTP